MSENTQILSLPLIQGGQAQKHITHNEALRALDALVQPVVFDIDRTTPPTLPDEGDRHIVAAGASGEWTGQDGSIAVREGDAWQFYAPAEGWRAHVRALDAELVFDGSDWAQPATATLGINTAADTTNRLAVASDATLLTHAGTGHQVKINKASTGETGSLLFQTAFSGRAEMGCAGSDDFAVKVSPDGTAWNTAMTVDAATGETRFPSGVRVPREVPLGGRWYCYTDNRWVTFSTSYGPTSENRNSSAGTGSEPSTSWTHIGLFVRGGTRLLSLDGMLRASSTQVTGYDLRICVQTGALDGSWNTASETQKTTIHASDNRPMGTAWHGLSADLTSTVVPQDSAVLIYIRPHGTLSGTRYLYSTLQLRLE
ncbi:DUF2793 domain-containing protein [Jannaschia marina]|uniref:DUF2793 domain-containing protein n=1 Tax=Jannaschia marina TaxID=2741674 RepID=UPI0015C7510C|nr:DUF2793 domain-containing protein [Jannaschia marina]